MNPMTAAALVLAVAAHACRCSRSEEGPTALNTSPNLDQSWPTEEENPGHSNPGHSSHVMPVIEPQLWELDQGTLVALDPPSPAARVSLSWAAWDTLSLVTGEQRYLAVATGSLVAFVGSLSGVAHDTVLLATEGWRSLHSTCGGRILLTENPQLPPEISTPQQPMRECPAQPQRAFE
ncbi:hypothetical protein EOD39_19598 [Acipenser ruthenus]|uniref:Uncharacterized protein n=1 Tax=Acipenser ruthenus TaxID=7906 RepID=A0A444UXS0_ACIRT|nr:hypothetical protein EOD39_19598 [Acipenser ruthenus]